MYNVVGCGIFANYLSLGTVRGNYKSRSWGTITVRNSCGRGLTVAINNRKRSLILCSMLNRNCPFFFFSLLEGGREEDGWNLIEDPIDDCSKFKLYRLLIFTRRRITRFENIGNFSKWILFTVRRIRKGDSKESLNYSSKNFFSTGYFRREWKETEFCSFRGLLLQEGHDVVRMTRAAERGTPHVGTKTLLRRACPHNGRAYVYFFSATMLLPRPVTKRKLHLTSSSKGNLKLARVSETTWNH